MINTVAFPSLRWHPEWKSLLQHSKNQSSFDFLPLDTPSTVTLGYNKQKRLVLSHLARADVGAYELLAASWGQISIASQKPLSRGTVRPKSSSVFDGPSVDPRYCADPLDCKIIRLGLQMVQKLMRTEAMKTLLPVVDARFNSSDARELMAALKPLVGTEYHPSGTTSMMPKALGGVVDSKLMVYGTCNLRVVDAGIMPMIPGAHIQAAVYAVAEKVSRCVLLSGWSMVFANPGFRPQTLSKTPQVVRKRVRWASRNGPLTTASFDRCTLWLSWGQHDVKVTIKGLLNRNGIHLAHLEQGLFCPSIDIFCAHAYVCGSSMTLHSGYFE